MFCLAVAVSDAGDTGLWVLCCCVGNGGKRPFVFYRRMATRRLQIPVRSYIGSRQHPLRDLDEIRGPTSFETMLYITMAVGADGGAGLSAFLG